MGFNSEEENKNKNETCSLNKNKYTYYHPIVVVHIRKSFFHCNHDHSTYRSMLPVQFSFLLESLAECENIDEAQHNLEHLSLSGFSICTSKSEMERKSRK